MSDLLDKILKFTSGRYFFVPLISLLTGDLHFTLSRHTIELTSFVTGGGNFKTVDLIEKYPDIWQLLKIGYKGVSILSLRGFFLFALTRGI